MEHGFSAKDSTSNGKGQLAQLVSAPPCHGGGRGFKSRTDRTMKGKK